MKSTPAAGEFAETSGCASGFILNKPPVVGQAVKLPPQPMNRVAIPVFEYAFESQTFAAAPWNRPAPPRNCIGRLLSKV
jgi:hypothetical protein